MSITTNFPLMEQLPAETKQEIARIQAIPEAQRLTSESGFLTSLTPFTETNSLTLKRFTANFGKYMRAKVVTGGTNPAYTLSLYIIGKGE